MAPPAPCPPTERTTAIDLIELTATGSAARRLPERPGTAIPGIGFSAVQPCRGADHHGIFNRSWICRERVAEIEAYTELDLQQRAWLGSEPVIQAPQARDYNLKHLRKPECEYRIQPLVGYHHALVVDIQSDTARHAKDPLRPANGEFRRNIAVVVDAPDAYISVVGRHICIRASASHADDDLALRRIDCERPAESVELALGSANDSLRLDVARIGAVENQEPGLATLASSRSSARD